MSSCPFLAERENESSRPAMAPPQDNSSATGGNGDGRSEKSLQRSIMNRTKRLCKKAYERTTLRDVQLALICYTPYAVEPTTWPPDRSKIEDAIRRYLNTPAHKKLAKNQITVDNPNPGADRKKEASKAAAEEEADRLRIPFPDDEDKLIALGGILESRLEAVRKVIAVRLMEAKWRDPRTSAGDRGKKLCQGQGRPPRPPATVAAPTASGGDPATSDRDLGKSMAGDGGPVRGRGRPDFSALATAAAVGGGVGAPNFRYPCPCYYCPVHQHWFTGSRDSRKY